MSQIQQLVLAGDLETSDGVRHPKKSGGTSGLTKQISSGKISEMDLLNKIPVQLPTKFFIETINK